MTTIQIDKEDKDTEISFSATLRLPSKKAPSISCVRIIQQSYYGTGLLQEAHEIKASSMAHLETYVFTLYINCRSRAEETKTHG